MKVFKPKKNRNRADCICLCMCDSTGAADAGNAANTAGTSETSETATPCPPGGTAAAAECPVCNVAMCDVLTPCAHAFCTTCISAWRRVSSACPICRADLRTCAPNDGLRRFVIELSDGASDDEEEEEDEFEPYASSDQPAEPDGEPPSPTSCIVAHDGRTYLDFCVSPAMFTVLQNAAAALA